MTLSGDNTPPKGRNNAGAVPELGPAHAAPAHSLTVGAVGFGPAWTMEDSMAASIVRLQCEVEEREARIAVLEEQARILVAERDQARLQYRSTEALAMALVKTINEMKEERVDLKLKIEALRDQICQDKCRDKAAADGGWANI